MKKNKKITFLDILKKIGIFYLATIAVALLILIPYLIFRPQLGNQMLHEDFRDIVVGLDVLIIIGVFVRMKLFKKGKVKKGNTMLFLTFIFVFFVLNGILFTQFNIKAKSTVLINISSFMTFSMTALIFMLFQKYSFSKEEQRKKKEILKKKENLLILEECYSQNIDKMNQFIASNTLKKDDDYYYYLSESKLNISQKIILEYQKKLRMLLEYLKLQNYIEVGELNSFIEKNKMSVYVEKMRKSLSPFIEEGKSTKIYDVVEKYMNVYGVKKTYPHNVEALSRYLQLDSEQVYSMIIQMEQKMLAKRREEKMEKELFGKQESLDDILLRMNGRDFEDFLVEHFRSLGLIVKDLPYSGDYGADLIFNWNGLKVVVQAKKYAMENATSLPAIQEVVSAVNYYKGDLGMVITTSYFTQGAINLARESNVVLMDYEGLQKLWIEGSHYLLELLSKYY